MGVNDDIRAPSSELERTFIEEYVRARGYDPAELPDLPPWQRSALLHDAGLYASAKLVEVEARASHREVTENRHTVA